MKKIEAGEKGGQGMVNSPFSSTLGLDCPPAVTDICISKYNCFRYILIFISSPYNPTSLCAATKDLALDVMKIAWPLQTLCKQARSPFTFQQSAQALSTLEKCISLNYMDFKKRLLEMAQTPKTGT